MSKLSGVNLFSVIANKNKEEQKLPIYIINKPIDCRISVNGLCIYIAEYLQQNPQQGIYVFYNRFRTIMKLVYWDYTGFVLINKHLEAGYFNIRLESNEKVTVITQEQLNWLFNGLDWYLKSKMLPSFFLIILRDLHSRSNDVSCAL